MSLLKLSLPDKISKIYVGLSGGVDSTALLLILAEKFPKKITAIHFNHGLRDESAQEQTWCENLCSEKNISFQTFNLNVPENINKGESIESAARRLRLEKWQEIVTDSQTSLIALAHHRDDVNENFFIRLMRGSGLSGLTGLQEFSNINNLTFWRPLLKFPKKKLVDYLKKQNIDSWCEDASNKENIFRRNSIRNRLLPLFSEIASGTHALENSIEKLTEEANFLDQLAEKEFRKIKKAENIQSWQNIPKPLLHRVFRLFMKQASNCDFICNNATIDRIHQEIQTATSAEKTVPLDSQLNLFISAKGLKIINKEEKNIPQETLWNPLQTPILKFGEYTLSAELVEKMSKKDKNHQFFNLNELTFPLTVRNSQPGDRIKTFGGMNKKVKNIFIDQKIPKSEREHIPLIVSKGKLIWIAGITRSNHAPVCENTATIIKLTLTSQR